MHSLLLFLLAQRVHSRVRLSLEHMLRGKEERMRGSFLRALFRRLPTTVFGFLVCVSSVRKPFDSQVRLNRTRARRRDARSRSTFSIPLWAQSRLGPTLHSRLPIGERATVLPEPSLALVVVDSLSPAPFRLACGLTSKSLLPQRRAQQVPRQQAGHAHQPTAAIDEAGSVRIADSQVLSIHRSPPQQVVSRLVSLARTERLSAQQGAGGTTLTIIDLPPRWPPAKGQSAS